MLRLRAQHDTDWPRREAENRDRWVNGKETDFGQEAFTSVGMARHARFGFGVRAVRRN